jgi:hypothetical protein
MNAPSTMAAWKRWLLFAVLVAWGLCYITCFAFFVDRSRDFIAAERSAAVCALAPTDSTTLAFGSADVNPHMLAAGWATPEPWGVWSIATRALLVLPVPASVHGDARLEFELLAPINEKFPELSVAIAIEGDPHARWLLRAENAHRPQPLDIPARLLDGRRCIAIGFEFDDAYRPIKEGLGPDARLLGIGLVGATWHRREAP